ncbi:MULTISPECIES: hypothetical protein [Nocardia]|uniref:Uncharacterized protein n=1 Tax=Nocardia nova TaxID=37330 RepID=A0A2T2Z8A0_9NOCA|nr:MULTISPECIES: hypothetical protein [Nocardia]PSR63984.1 hypothetical protein C8259_09030 [Nocardia nova]
MIVSSRIVTGLGGAVRSAARQASGVFRVALAAVPGEGVAVRDLDWLAPNVGQAGRVDVIGEVA